MSNRGDGMSHITFDKLADYVDGRLDEADADQIAFHIASGCGSCSADLHWLEHTISRMNSDVWVEPPSNLNSAIISAYKEQFRPTETNPSLADQISAFLRPRPALAWAAVAAIVLITFVFALQFNGGRSVNQEATAGASQGDVVVQAADSEEWQPVEEDQSIKAGDTVKTGGNSTMVLTYDDQSVTIVEPNSELTVVEMTAARDGSSQVTILAQNSGRTTHRVNKLNDDGSIFEVRTPSATVAVVGTVFSVEVDGNGNTGVTVNEGVVAVTGGGQLVRVAAGEGTTVQVDGEPEQPTRNLAGPSPTSEPEQVESSALATATDLAEDDPTETEEPEASRTQTPTPRDPTETVTAVPSDTPGQSTIPPTPTPTRVSTDTPQPTVAPPQPTSKPPTSTPILPPPTPTPQPTNSPVPPTSTPIPPEPTSTPSEPTPPYPGDTTPEATKVPPGQTKTPQPPGHDEDKKPTKTPKP